MLLYIMSEEPLKGFIYKYDTKYDMKIKNIVNKGSLRY